MNTDCSYIFKVMVRVGVGLGSLKLHGNNPTKPTKRYDTLVPMTAADQ